MSPIDLHIHTTASDGSLTLAEILPMASECGLTAIAVTDHDSVKGIEGKLLANPWAIEVIPGIEIGIREDPNRDLIDIDILGYFIDYNHPDLLYALEKIAEARQIWAEEQLGLLERKLKIKIPRQTVYEAAAESPCIRRPHIWSTIKKHFPYCLSRHEFYSSTERGGKFFVEKSFELSLEESINLIHKIGGLAVLAHPFAYPKVRGHKVEQLVFASVTAGIDGIEAWYPYTKSSREVKRGSDITFINQALELGKKYNLICTAGSDFHGPDVNDTKLGDIIGNDSILEDIKVRLMRA